MTRTAPHLASWLLGGVFVVGCHGKTEAQGAASDRAAASDASPSSERASGEQPSEGASRGESPTPLPPIPPLEEGDEELRVSLAGQQSLIVRWAEFGEGFDDGFDAWLVDTVEGASVVRDHMTDPQVFTGLTAVQLEEAGCAETRMVGYEQDPELALEDGRTVFHVSLGCMAGEDARATQELLVLFAQPPAPVKSLSALERLWSGRGGWVSSLHDTCIRHGRRSPLTEHPTKPGTLLMKVRGDMEFDAGEGNWAGLDPDDCDIPETEFRDLVLAASRATK